MSLLHALRRTSDKSDRKEEKKVIRAPRITVSLLEPTSIEHLAAQDVGSQALGLGFGADGRACVAGSLASPRFVQSHRPVLGCFRECHRLPLHLRTVSPSLRFAI